MKLNRKKMLGFAVAIAVTSMIFSGCGNSSSNSGSKEIRSEINVAMNAEPETYDLTKTTGTNAKYMALGNVFEMLVGYDGDYKVQPDLAEKFEVSADNTEYTYYLRRGVQFHNGQEMKADDVVASMNRWIDSNKSVKNAVGNARFEKVDDYTVKIKMDQPLSVLNDMICGIKPTAIIVPKSVIDNADPKTGMIKDYIGTGPYKFDEIVANDHVKLIKFDGYKPHGEKGKASGWVGYKEAKTPVINFRFITDSSTRVAGMQSGEYDLAIQMPGDDYGQFKGNKAFNIEKELNGDVSMVYNKKVGIASNKAFRKAVNTALNREDILKAAFNNEEFYKITPSYVQPEKSEWYTEAGKDVFNPSDPAKAKELLEAAGYNGEPFRLMVSNQYTEFYNAAIVVQKELEDIGVNVELDVVDWPTYLTNAKDKNKYDAFITGFNTYLIPNNVLYLSASWNGWSDDSQLQKALTDIAHSSNVNATKAEWEKAQVYCWSDYVPVSKFGNRYNYAVSSSKVKNLIYFEGPHMWNVTVEK